MGVASTGMSANKGDALKSSDYVHLHNHTHHSVLDGLTKIPDLVNFVKETGMEAVALTDHGTMSGAIEFYRAAQSAGVKPIIGIEAYVATRSRHDRDPSKDKNRYHLTILAMNNKGYQNLMKLSSVANLEGVYYKPRMDREILEKYNEGLIVLSGCASGEVAEYLRLDDYDKAKEVVLWYKQVFGDRYYLEMQDHGHAEYPSIENPHPWEVQTKINQYLEKLSAETDVPLVISCDAHYLTHDYKDAHEILLCVGTGAFLSDTNRMSLKDFDLHVTDPKDIISRWGKSHPEAILNTKKVADRCDVTLEFGKILIPKFPTPNGETDKEYLDKLVYRGMAIRYGGKTFEEADKLSEKEIRELLAEEQLERLDMEFEVLTRMGYNGYFLIVQDFINWGKDRGIIFGPGRGSAAGSIISYALKITDLDPLEYDLLFERFLNPDRISMPDIDIDIQDTRRDEVIEYCANKYGSERVANIMTFGTMAARGAVRDVARVLEVPYAESDRLAKTIPPPSQGRHIPLQKSIKEDADLKKEYDENPTAREVLDYAVQLEGTIRSHGVHAAGVVIAPDDLVKYVPLEMAQKGVVATQYPMGPVEDLGLLKMDFLGLSNLTTINNALRIIKKVNNVSIDLASLDLNDKKTYELFQRGDTTGVFQLESAGMKRYLRELKPSVFEDIVAMVALYRPGPMQFIDSFIKRKHGEEEITYLHEGLKGALENTYGTLIYQEQFMQISKDWCGFTGGQADTLRKAVGKKKIDLMKQVKPEFIEGAVKISGATKEVAETFWNQLEEFANYSFNKSHAACYALIAYWTAYLKAHYPEAFMAAVMTSDHDDTDRLAIEIAECNRMGISVLPPDVNESYMEFAIVPNKKQIRFGMTAVKGVGAGAVEALLETRDKDGKFTNIEDFARRVSTSKFNKKAWESLIKSGGFDAFGDRSDILFNLESIIAFAQKIQKEALSGQTDLFGTLSESASNVQPTISITPAPAKYSEKEQLMWERELMGLYLSSHPLDNYDAYFNEQTTPLAHISQDVDGRSVTVGGLISTTRTIITKSGTKMAFIKIEDKVGEIEVVVFPNLFEQIGAKLIQDNVIRVGGKVNARDRDGNLRSDISIIANEIFEVTDDELRNYESTGRVMKAPKISKKVKAEKLAQYRAKKAGDKKDTATSSGPLADSSSKVKSNPSVVSAAKILKPKVLYLKISKSNDVEQLKAINQTCRKFPGNSDVVIVIGEGEEKSAMKVPFKIEDKNSLINELVKLLGEDNVILK